MNRKINILGYIMIFLSSWVPLLYQITTITILKTTTNKITDSFHNKSIQNLVSLGLIRIGVLLLFIVFSQFVEISKISVENYQMYDGILDLLIKGSADEIMASNACIMLFGYILLYFYTIAHTFVTTVIYVLKKEKAQ